MGALLQQLLVLCIFIALGWLLGGLRKDAGEKSSLLSYLLVNLFLPCKIFLSYADQFTVSYVQDNYLSFFIATGVLLVLVAITLFLPRLLTKHPYEQKVYSYNITVPNFSYFGYVLVEQVFGPVAMNNMMVFCIPLTIYCYTFGVSMLKNQKVTIRSLLNTITIAMVVGMIWGLMKLPLPGIVRSVMTGASSCVGPLSMVLVGLVLSTFSLKDLIPNRQAVLFCGIRLLVLPAMVFGVCKGLAALMPLPDAVYPSAVLMACMPCGLNAVIFPRLVNQDCRLGAKLVLLSSLLSCATIPIWLWII